MIQVIFENFIKENNNKNILVKNSSIKTKSLFSYKHEINVVKTLFWVKN